MARNLKVLGLLAVSTLLAFAVGVRSQSTARKFPLAEVAHKPMPITVLDWAFLQAKVNLLQDGKQSEHFGFPKYSYNAEKNRVEGTIMVDPFWYAKVDVQTLKTELFPTSLDCSAVDSALMEYNVFLFGDRPGHLVSPECVLTFQIPNIKATTREDALRTIAISENGKLSIIMIRVDK